MNANAQMPANHCTTYTVAFHVVGNAKYYFTLLIAYLHLVILTPADMSMLAHITRHGAMAANLYFAIV